MRLAPSRLRGLLARAVLASLCLLTASGTAIGQEPMPPGAPTAPGDPATAPEPQPLRIGSAVLSGYIQYDYRSVGDGGADGFYFRRVRVQLAGPLASGVKYLINAETTNAPSLRDALIILDHFPAATVRIGQQVLPYSHERAVMSSNVMPFTERILSELTPARDAGLTISNERPFFGWFGYAVGVHNGTGQNVRDNNKAKDSLLRFTATPPQIPGFALGVNAAQGEQPEGMRRRVGGDIAFVRRTFEFGAEFLRERTRDGQQTQDGLYVFASRMFYPKTPIPGLHHLEFATRYSRLEGPREGRQWEFAGNYYAHKGLRFMFDLIVPGGAERDERGVGLHARANLRF